MEVLSGEEMPAQADSFLGCGGQEKGASPARRHPSIINKKPHESPWGLYGCPSLI
jgi:hypothetical protein